jgi:hypothetical protein
MTRTLRHLAVLLASGSLSANAGPQQSPENQGSLPGLAGVTVTVEPGTIQPDALRKCESLKGYADLQKQFTLEQARQGYINRLEESLFTILRAESAKSLNAAWWFNPIASGKARYDWNDFLKLFHRVDSRLSRHTWLADWRAATSNRRLELHAFGREPEAEADEIAFQVLPIWREAGFAGKPQYEVLARLADTSWFQMFFNDQDPRLLVSYSMDPPAKPLHWLDGIDVEFHPKCEPGAPSSKYAVIEQNGQMQIREYRKCPP